MPKACQAARPCHQRRDFHFASQRLARLDRASQHARARPASSVAARQWPIPRSSTAPPPVPPPSTPASPPFEIGSPKQQERCNKLSLRPILSNRFIDENALAQVGLRDAVTEPLRHTGWGQFIDMKDLVYAPFTLEFLSSYSS
ncbi:hypothetical protein JCGZ_24405 [Jatropha curcas]|uniref:Uncharacterized protein n=1 Tax=Jatropha curcas TaxID=180498 RepID=A0A067JMM6_JATCU|nr:hypothetical protein JCGZ_24405 [Jatropha curcas]